MVEFIDYSRGYIKYIAFKYLTDKSLIDDVIYSTYNKILHNIQSFDKSKNGLAWMAKTAQNEAFAINNAETKQKNISAQNINELEVFDEDQRLISFMVERAMGMLEEDEREIVEYNIFMGLTIREISKIKGMPKSTVAYKLKQALSRLKDFLA